MVDSSVRFQPSTLPEAARILGVSESTVRRLVKAGKLEAERVLRPQGHVWMVMAPAPSTAPADDPPRWIGASPANPPEQPAPTVTSPALTAWMSSVLEPLVTELGTSRQRIEHLARENGRQSAELERAAATIVTLSDALEARTPTQNAKALRELSPARWRSWVPWLLALAALVAVVGLLAWPG